MRITPTDLPEVLLIEPDVFGDNRGFFLETWNRRAFAELGFDEVFVQDNHSRSSKNVLRGIHYQLPNPQGKLVRAVRGAIWDVAVDLRASSPRFGRWVGVRLDDEHHQQLWVPAGFGHGFVVLSDVADVAYKTTTHYDRRADRAIRYDDPDIGIAWPGSYFTVSDKDQAAPPLKGALVYD